MRKQKNINQTNSKLQIILFMLIFVNKCLPICTMNISQIYLSIAYQTRLYLRTYCAHHKTALLMYKLELNFTCQLRNIRYTNIALICCRHYGCALGWLSPYIPVCMASSTMCDIPRWAQHVWCDTCLLILMINRNNSNNYRHYTIPYTQINIVDFWMLQNRTA